MNRQINRTTHAQRASWTPVDAFGELGDEAREVASELSSHGFVNPDEIRRRLSWPEQDQQVLQRMLDVAVSPRATSTLGIRVPEVQESSVDAAEKERFMSIMSKNVSGQEAAKEALWLAIQNRGEELEAAPYVIGLPGPPGVGKTSLAHALAEYLHGDRSLVAKLDMSQIKNEYDLGIYLGTNPGLRGFTEKLKSPISVSTIEEQFKERRPVVFLLDEVDKVGSGQDAEEVKRSTFDILTGFLQDGALQFRNGEILTEEDCIVMMTSNAGADEAKGREPGEALSKHYKNAMAGLLPEHIIDRISAIVPCVALTAHQGIEIARTNLNNAFETAESRAQETANKSIRLDASDEACGVLAELGVGEGSARALGQLLRRLIHPMILNAMKRSKDGESWTLKVKQDPHDSQSIESQIERLKRQFRTDDGKVPQGVTSDDLPLEFVCNDPAPAFVDYGGSVPGLNDEAWSMIAMGSGVVDGKGFLLSKDTWGVNHLHLLKCGRDEGADEFTEIHNLPEQIRSAFDVKAVAVSAKRLYLSGVTLEDGAQEASVYSVFYDVDTKKYSDAPSLPVALYGHCIAATDETIVAAGGRCITQDETGAWQVVLDVADEPGTPSEDAIWVLKPCAEAWQLSQATLNSGRAGAAATAVNGKILIAGGEETALTTNGVAITKASTCCDFFDPSSDTASKGPELSGGVSSSTAMTDARGVRLCGGRTFTDQGRQAPQLSATWTLDAGNAAAQWKQSADGRMPLPGSELAIIPHVDGVLVGPFYDGEGHATFKALR